MYRWDVTERFSSALTSLAQSTCNRRAKFGPEKHKFSYVSNIEISPFFVAVVGWFKTFEQHGMRYRVHRRYPFRSVVVLFRPHFLGILCLMPQLISMYRGRYMETCTHHIILKKCISVGVDSVNLDHFWPFLWKLSKIDFLRLITKTTYNIIQLVHTAHPSQNNLNGSP